MKIKYSFIIFIIFALLIGFYFFNKREKPNETKINVYTSYESFSDLTIVSSKLRIPSFWDKKETTINKTNPSESIFTKNTSGFFNIIFKKRAFPIYVESGDSITINFSPDKGGLIKANFYGNNSFGNNYLPNKHRLLFIDEGQHLKSQYKTIEEAQKTAFLKKDKEAKSIDSLYHTGDISKSFRNALIAESKTYYTSVALRIIIDTLINLDILSKRIALPQSSTQYFITIKKEVMKYYDVNDPISISTPHYYHLVESLIDFEYIFDTKNNKQRAFDKYSNLIEEYYLKGLKNLDLSKEAYEITSALLLDHYIFQEKANSKYLLGFWKDYKKQYPKSDYIPLYERQMKYFEDSHTKNNSALKLIENSDKIKSIPQLLEMFKNQVVFADIWATWCQPCIKEFEYNQQLTNFTKGHNITKLFISIDKNDLNEKWREDILYYNLEGYHIRASKELSTDLMNYFGSNTTQGKVLSIPQYFIIKNGRIVKVNANRPSSKEILYEQLKSFI